MVRLVFRPYTQVRKAICTSAHLRASTRFSPGFTLLRHSSPSFGSQQICSHSNLSSENHDRSMVRQRLPPQRASTPLLSFRPRVYRPRTRICVRLLGPCFKTGRLVPFRQHPGKPFAPQSTPRHAPRVKDAGSRRSRAALPPQGRVPAARTDADTTTPPRRRRRYWFQPLPF